MCRERTVTMGEKKGGVFPVIGKEILAGLGKQRRLTTKQKRMREKGRKGGHERQDSHD